MTTNGTSGTYISLYERRVRLVAAAVKQDTELTAETADAMARRALYALDHIPEKMR